MKDQLADRTLTRNVFKKYEGFALVNLTDTFWKHKKPCGHVYMNDVTFYQPDPVQVVDDRFVQITYEKQSSRNKTLKCLNFKVQYAFLTTLAPNAETLDLQRTQVVMMRKFMQSLMSTHRFKSSQFLQTDPASGLVSYNNDQLYNLDMQLQPYMTNLNEIKLDLCCIEVHQSHPEHSYMRAQIFLRKVGEGC